ncbi:uncharacterized protein WM277_021047 isoform 3-T3 [Molossus nigricans]
MATYPPRRLLGARPLPSDPCRDPRRSGFPQGSGGSPLNLRCTFTHFQGPAARHITSRETWACAFPEQRLYFQPPYSRVVVLADKQHCEPRHPSHIWHLEGPCKLLDVSCPAELMKTWETAQALPSVRHTALPLWRHCDKCPWHEGILQGCLLSDSTRAQAALFLPLLSYVFVQVLC